VNHGYRYRLYTTGTNNERVAALALGALFVARVECVGLCDVCERCSSWPSRSEGASLRGHILEEEVIGPPSATYVAQDLLAAGLSPRSPWPAAHHQRGVEFILFYLFVWCWWEGSLVRKVSLARGGASSEVMVTDGSSALFEGSDTTRHSLVVVVVIHQSSAQPSSSASRHTKKEGKNEEER
jgi:hypothetical protein